MMSSWCCRHTRPETHNTRRSNWRSFYPYFVDGVVVFEFAVEVLDLTDLCHREKERGYGGSARSLKNCGVFWCVSFVCVWGPRMIPEEHCVIVVFPYCAYKSRELLVILYSSRKMSVTSLHLATPSGPRSKL
jgi:hypothetical protein